MTLNQWCAIGNFKKGSKQHQMKNVKIVRNRHHQNKYIWRGKYQKGLRTTRPSRLCYLL